MREKEKKSQNDAAHAARHEMGIEAYMASHEVKMCAFRECFARWKSSVGGILPSGFLSIMKLMIIPVSSPFFSPHKNGEQCA